MDYNVYTNLTMIAIILLIINIYLTITRVDCINKIDREIKRNHPYKIPVRLLQMQIPPQLQIPPPIQQNITLQTKDDPNPPYKSTLYDNRSDLSFKLLGNLYKQNNGNNSSDDRYRFLNVYGRYYGGKYEYYYTNSDNSIKFTIDNKKNKEIYDNDSITLPEFNNDVFRFKERNMEYRYLPPDIIK